MKKLFLILLGTYPALSFSDCIQDASQFHRVNPTVLSAIIMVESGGKAHTIAKNSNNTLDYGAAGINTIHMPELKKHGIAPTDLMNPCVNTYVAAWHLSKKIAQFGNTWYGIAAYHSTTPYFNNRYQIMLNNALIDMGVSQGNKRPVPPLRPNGSKVTSASSSGQKKEEQSSSMVVVNN